MQNSLWLYNNDSISLPTLSTSVNCDVCIIGGGLTGIYTAYLLAKKGINVVLLEAKDAIAEGTTAHSTGKLTTQHGIVYSKLIKGFNENVAKNYYNVNQMAIETALSNATVDIYQQVSSYVYATTEHGKQTISDELKAYKQLQIPGIETNETELPFAITSAIKVDNTYQIHPTNFTVHFAKAALKEGASLYVNTRVTKIAINENYVLTEQNHRVSFKKLILCSHYPIESIKGLLMLKLSVERSYLLATKTSELLQGQYISVENPTRTLRTALISNTPYFIFGGSTHTAGSDSSTHMYYKSLENELETVFHLSSSEFKWSAQDPDTPDYIPYVGLISPNVPNLFVATGYRKWGLSNSLVAGEILAAATCDGKHTATELYSPSRSNFGKTLLRMLKVTGFITANLAGGYLTRLNTPKCTHLGCKTRWNKADETWDCPCHGSRFSKNGQIIEGPAVYPLDI